jgi:hypothetical protein
MGWSRQASDALELISSSYERNILFEGTPQTIEG